MSARQGNQPPQFNQQGIIRRGDLRGEIDPNKNPGFVFRPDMLADGQFKGTTYADPEELGRLQKEFEKQLNLQNAILGR